MPVQNSKIQVVQRPKGKVKAVDNPYAEFNGNALVPEARRTFLQPSSKQLPSSGRPPMKLDKLQSTEVATSIGGERGEPAYLIPSFKRGEFLKSPLQEWYKTGEHLGGPFKTWQEADKWDKEVRHPYVEKGQDIPSPLKWWGEGFASGGNLYGPGGDLPIVEDQSQLPSKKERLIRQAFAESSLSSGEVQSRVGALGPLQIMPDAYKDYVKGTGDASKYETVKEFPQAIKVRNWLMDNISNADFIKGKKQTEAVRMAKIYGSYNYGKGNMLDYLNSAKSKGADIYNSTKWVDGLPTETKDYINKILFKKSSTFEKEFNNAIKTNPNIKYFK